MNEKLEFNHFKDINDLLKNIDVWYQEDDIYYDRWFGLEDLKKLKDYIINLQTKWDSLREWLIHLKNSYMETDNIFDDAKFRIILTILDKMNELEGGDNENN